MPVPRLSKAQFEAALSRSQAETGSGVETERDPVAQQVWALIEPHLEDKARFQTEVRDHLAEATIDVKSWRGFRSLAMIFAIIIVVLSVVTLGMILFCPSSSVTLTKLPSDSVRITVLAGPFAIIFGLTAIIMRGAFSPTKHEEVSPPLPEAAKLLAESLSHIMSGKG